MFCMKCGKQMPDGVVFCMNCGEKMAALTPSPQPQPQPLPQPQPIQEEDKTAVRRGILSLVFAGLSLLCYLLCFITQIGDLLWVAYYSGLLGLFFSTTGSMLNSALRTAIIGLSLYHALDFASKFRIKMTLFLFRETIPYLIIIVILGVILFLRRKKTANHRRTTPGMIGFIGSICSILVFVIWFIMWLIEVRS